MSASFTLRYAVKRGEIWDWYWRAWRQPRGLWSYWLFVLSIIFGVGLLVAAAGDGLTPTNLVSTFLIPVTVVGFFILFPQLSFKSRERLLIVSQTGIETQIGEMSARRLWEDVSYIVERESYIAICIAGGISLGRFWIRTRNGNAFIVPRRAFASEAEFKGFLSVILEWHRERRLTFPRIAASRYYAGT